MSEWRITRGRYSSPMHMALDEVITNQVADGGLPTLRIWEWEQPTVVIGTFQSVRDEVFEEMAAKNGVEIVRRSTGGGAMFTQPGRVITYSLSLPADQVNNDILASYRELEDWSLAALQEMGVAADHEPINDIVHPETGQKIGGSAQARRDGAVLHHTMLSYDMDMETLLQVLKIGEEKISDKAIESAEKRVSPISSQIDAPREAVIDTLIGRFSDGHSITEEPVTAAEERAAQELVEEKYGTTAWTYRIDREIEGAT